MSEKVKIYKSHSDQVNYHPTSARERRHMVKQNKVNKEEEEKCRKNTPMSR